LLPSFLSIVECNGSHHIPSRNCNNRSIGLKGGIMGIKSWANQLLFQLLTG